MTTRRHTVIVSDVHLSQTHPRDDSDPLWMRYRWSDYHPDSDFEAFADALASACKSDAIEIVFNGDVFDFDAPMVVDGTSSFEEFALDDAGCAEQVRRIVRDHPRFFRAVARLLLDGHRVLFLSGNHDVELYWPGVRRALRESLRDAATALDPTRSPSELDALEERIRFRTWFHVTEDKIYIEHGSQYDMLNGLPDPMRPLVRDASGIQPVCGKLAFKRTGARMGYFNPYCEDTFYMGLFGYLRHFVTQYLFSRRHIVRTWLFGSISTALEILRHRRPHEPSLSEASIARAAEETAASREAIVATHALRVPSAERSMLPILRELWLDRTLFAGVVVIVATLGGAIGGSTAFAVTLAVMIAAFVLYELKTPKPDIRTYDSAPPSVERIFEIHDVRALCMGHTHRPIGTWSASRFRGNSGSWCPAFTDVECTKPVLDGRPFLMLTAEAGALCGGLHWFRNGGIAPDPNGSRDAWLAQSHSASEGLRCDP